MKDIDRDHLKSMIDHFIQEKLNKVDLEQQILMLSGAGLNWIGDYITDENIAWEKKILKVADLYLTGVGGPDWIKIVIQECERSPKKLKEFMALSAENRAIFDQATFSPHPILVRFEDDKLKVLDGMHRVVAAIRDDIHEVTAFIATQTGAPKPHCEAHVIYDFIRAYQRGINKDRKGIITALRWLKNSYSNVDDLLRNRFGPDWINEPEIREIINEVLV